MTHEETVALRKKQLEDFSASGQSSKVWYRNNQVPLTTLYYWKKRLSPPQQVKDRAK